MSEGKPTFGASIVSSDVDASVAFYRTLEARLPEALTNDLEPVMHSRFR